jgi:hypothetical protein
MTRLPVRRLASIVVGLACAIYLPRIIPATAPIAEKLIPAARLDVVGSFAKLACLVAGAVFGLRGAFRLEPGNRARASWMMLGAWLAFFSIGQLVLMSYPLVLGVPPPLPSPGDVFFLAGYALLILASLRFIAAYRASGFPVGTTGEHLGIAAGAAAVCALAGYPVLAPIVRAGVPLGERIINMAYPVLDFAALVPAVVMLRITLAFRGGKVWTIWAALITGCVLMAVGDILFAHFSSAKITAFAPGVDLMFLLGYFASACGVMLQWEMLTE